MLYHEFFKNAEAVTLSSPIAEFEADAAQPLRFRKELIYAGRHVKKRAGQKKPDYVLEVDKPLIDHWVATHAAMSSEGVEVPAPLKHTTDPTANRGKWIGLEAGINKDGKDALYGVIEFADAEAAKLAKTTNVSIYVVNEYTSGKGTTFKAPIRHIALTDYPIVPGLSKFEALAADEEGVIDTETKPSVLKTLLGSLFQEFDVTPVGDDAQDAELLLNATNGMKTQLASVLAMSDDEEEETDPDTDKVKKSNARLFEVQTKVAMSEVDELVNDGVVTTHVGTKLKEAAKKHLKVPTEGIGLSSDDGEENEKVLACFSDFVNTLKGSKRVVRFGEKTGPQLLSGDTKTVLVANAEARRKK